MTHAWSRGIDLLLVGVAPGGTEVVDAVLEGVPRGLPFPVVVLVQDLQEDEAERLRHVPHLRLAVDKQPLAPGSCYLAPPGYHLLLEEGTVVLSVDGREHGVRPALAPLFESAAWAFRGAIAAILVGAVGPDAEAAASAVAPDKLLRGSPSAAGALLRALLARPEVSPDP